MKRGQQLTVVLLLDWKEISVRQGQFRVPGEEDQEAISVMQVRHRQCFRYLALLWAMQPLLGRCYELFS